MFSDEEEECRVQCLDEYMKQFLFILSAYENKKALVSGQGQAMDGYSALANFLDVARRAKKELDQYD